MKRITLLLFIWSCSIFSQKLSYPIIFIHGLNSNSAVWVDQANFFVSKGLTYGGQIDICLNFDGNNAIANKLIYPATNADTALFTSAAKLVIGDFYLLNFDIDNQGLLRTQSGFHDVLSNEAAIAKQGLALRYAIQMVLAKTGREKVIIMGHSMGGLCAREYLQNPVNWQSDGQHHIAKLITTGTPHGGYTGTNIAMLTGIDSGSEAYRDLRKEYSNNNAGVFLFGGTENSTTLGTNFYNNDVNCNGINNDNTSIVGLNQKNLLGNVDYAYVIGDCTNCFALQGKISGDGIVRSVNANLSNFYNLSLPKNEFIYTAAANNAFIGLHSDLPHAIVPNMQGLDEPNAFQLGYQLYANNIYRGFITEQPANGYAFDYDDYKFTINATGSVDINVVNTYSGPLSCAIFDSSFTQVAINTFAGNSSGTLTQTLTPGQYYLEFAATASTTSHNFPYSFNLTGTLDTNEVVTIKTSIYPNPATSSIFIQSDYTFDKIEIYNLLGQIVISTKDYTSGINIENLSSGSYIMKMYSKEIVDMRKIIKE